MCAHYHALTLQWRHGILMSLPPIVSLIHSNIIFCDKVSVRLCPASNRGGLESNSVHARCLPTSCRQDAGCRLQC